MSDPVIVVCMKCVFQKDNDIHLSDQVHAGHPLHAYQPQTCVHMGDTGCVSSGGVRLAYIIVCNIVFGRGR